MNITARKVISMSPYLRYYDGSTVQHIPFSATDANCTRISHPGNYMVAEIYLEGRWVVSVIPTQLDIEHYLAAIRQDTGQTILGEYLYIRNIDMREWLNKGK